MLENQISLKDEFLKRAYIYMAQNTDVVFRYLPKEFRTPEICLKAMKSDGDNIRYVPKKLRTMDICLAAIKTYCDKTSSNCWKPIGIDRQLEPKVCLFRYIPESIMKEAMFVLLKCANKWKESYANANVDDLINAGFSGLIDAAMCFDASRPVRFISFGVHYIRRYMGELARAS